MEEKKEISLEEIMDRLDDTVTQMENDKMTLEESYQAFSEGMKLVKMGNDAIDRVEKKIKVLMMEGEEDVEGYMAGKNTKYRRGIYPVPSKGRRL